MNSPVIERFAFCFLALCMSLVVMPLTAGAVELDGNLQVVDLSDLEGDLPLDATNTIQILWRTQDWEHSSYENPDWPRGGHDSLGYPAIVKNSHGRNADNKYYLYYAHHDPMSGIGCAVAESIAGPYKKISSSDSRVLTVPNYNPAGPNPGDPSHYSSPSVVWNQDEKLWFMYFHYYNHYWERERSGGWSRNRPGKGHQMTALATTPDLSSHKWTIWRDPALSELSAWKIVPVLPTTDEVWMESQSSYHTIVRLPGGRWLAFLRGTSTGGLPTVGFATSKDGRKWDHFAENPVIRPSMSWTVDSQEYRPKFIGYLGKNESGKNEFLVAWAEHSDAKIIYGKTTDFKTFRRDPRGYAKWGANQDGMVAARREGDKLYLFSGKYLNVMNLPVGKGVNPPAPYPHARSPERSSRGN